MNVSDTAHSGFEHKIFEESGTIVTCDREVELQVRSGMLTQVLQWVVTTGCFEFRSRFPLREEIFDGNGS
jgi:hypothetical protein